MANYKLKLIRPNRPCNRVLNEKHSNDLPEFRIRIGWKIVEGSNCIADSTVQTMCILEVWYVRYTVIICLAKL